MTAAPHALVFGGTGFLGAHAVTQLTAAGFTVTATTRQHGATPGTVRCDLWRVPARSLTELIATVRPTLVVNCVGVTSGDPDALVAGNVTVPVRLLAAVAAAAPHARFVHLGSAAEYGSPGARHPLAEDAPCAPISPYGVSKLAGTRLVLRAADDAGIDAAVLRVFNPVGSGSPETSLAGRTARLLREAAAARPQPAITLGSLSSSRDWVDARDVGNAIVAASFSRSADARLVNVAGGRAIPARRVVDLIAAELGYRGEIREDRQPNSRSSAVDWQQADISLAERQFGWRPRHTVAESVADLCRSLDRSAETTDRVCARLRG